MAKSYSIKGGNALVGKVNPILNKNSLMGALPLSVLNCGHITYEQLPKTRDVRQYLHILSDLGVQIEKKGEKTCIRNDSVSSFKVDEKTGKYFRGAFSLVGSLLARFGQARVPIPGGCKLGMRSISTHINAFKDLGVVVKESGDMLHFKTPIFQQKNNRTWLLEASVTATLNLSAYAAASPGTTEILDAACEPHVQDVLHTLVRMGAEIEGIGTHHLKIKGNADLKPASFKASPDFVDVSGYFVAAAITQGHIVVKNANIPHIMDGIVKWMHLFNVKIEKKGKDLIVKGDRELKIKKAHFPLAGRELPKFAARPWPGFPVDVLPVMVILATKAKGAMVFQNWMYESGFDYIRELNYLGADIYMSDPQKIMVMEHVVKYSGGEVTAPRIIQGAKAIFLAALADKTQSILHGMDILNRRYPDIFETYKKLGADVKNL